jgi:transposase
MHTSFHTLPREVRADRRRQAFKLLDRGSDKYEVADFVEVHFKTVEDWVRDRAWYETHDYHGRKRGNPNDQKILDPAQEKEILRVIKDSTPDAEGVASFLWSRKAIREYVQTKYRKTLSPQIISLYTKRWGLSSQRPKRCATEQDEAQVRVWLEHTYPQIMRRAKKEGAVIHWGDETSININTNYQRTYAPKGKTPVAKIPARKTSYAMVSSLTNQGTLRYMVYRGGMNARLFRTFLQRLIKDTDHKVFLILDNLKVHHAKLIQAWQKEHADRIEIFFPTPILPAGESR